MSREQIEVVPEHAMGAVVWKGEPVGRRDQNEDVPAALRDALLWFAEVMYCRFEFARCAYWGVVVPTPEHFKRLFPWTFARKTFLGSPGEATYLDDLRKDIERAGKKKGPEARAMLKYFTEITRCPLYNFGRTGVQDADIVDDFFPDPDLAAERLRDYCCQLIDLQTYLIKDIGVRPGTLLPVWIQTDPLQVAPLPETVLMEEAGGVRRSPRLPVLGVLAEDPYMAQVLSGFLAWEYGGECHVPKQPRRGRGVDFYCRAVKWGRISFHRFLQVLFAEGLSAANEDNPWLTMLTGGELKDMKPLKDVLAESEFKPTGAHPTPAMRDKQAKLRVLDGVKAIHLGHVESDGVARLKGKATKNQKRQVVDALPESSCLKNYPLTGSDEMRKVLEAIPKLGILYKRSISEPTKQQVMVSHATSVNVRSSLITSLVNDPAFRKDAEETMKCGSKLIHAAYKNLWRL